MRWRSRQAWQRSVPQGVAPVGGWLRQFTATVGFIEGRHASSQIVPRIKLLVGHPIQRGPVIPVVDFRRLDGCLLLGSATSLPSRPLLRPRRTAGNSNSLRNGGVLGARRRRNERREDKSCRKHCSHCGFPVDLRSSDAPLPSLHRLRVKMEASPPVGCCTLSSSTLRLLAGTPPVHPRKATSVESSLGNGKVTETLTVLIHGSDLSRVSTACDCRFHITQKILSAARSLSEVYMMDVFSFAGKISRLKFG
jgi:hypothetical protein